MGPHFVDSNGACWSAAYINEGGNVVRDLRSDIAAEAGARQTYEALIKIAPDKGTEKTLHTLLTREIAHTKMFMAALQSLDKLDDPMFGNVPPDDTVKLYFNLSKDKREKMCVAPGMTTIPSTIEPIRNHRAQCPRILRILTMKEVPRVPMGSLRHARPNSRPGPASPGTNQAD